MPALTSHHSAQTTKMLLVGDSGAGKTGALASLASAGYNLRIIDLDNGLDVLKNLLTSPKGGYSPEAAARVHYQTITDPMRNVGGKLIPRSATVWQRTVKLLDNWKTEGEDFGPVTSWSSQEILVIDSLSFLCNAAMNFVLSMNSRLGAPAQQGDWYQAQQLVEGLLQTLYDDGIKANIVINCHITYIGNDNDVQHGYPASLGKALSPKIGRYFNSVLMARSSGQGTGVKRKILTNSTGMVELKNTAPSRVKGEYDLATGLAEYFKDVRGASPAGGTQT